MRILSLIALALSLSGCGLSQRVQLGDRSGPGNKTVTAKEAPSTLVAVDGSICRVTAVRFEKVKTGDRIWCYWRGRGEGGPDAGPTVGPPVGRPPDWNGAFSGGIDDGISLR